MEEIIKKISMSTRPHCFQCSSTKSNFSALTVPNKGLLLLLKINIYYQGTYVGKLISPGDFSVFPTTKYLSFHYYIYLSHFKSITKVISLIEHLKHIITLNLLQHFLAVSGYNQAITAKHSSFIMITQSLTLLSFSFNYMILNC